MPTRKLFRLIHLCSWFAAALCSAQIQAASVQSDHVQSELLAEDQSTAAGATSWLALRISPEAGWHVYWRNPGDSGLPTKILWTLPDGVSAGDLVWPYPERSQIADIINYGYSETRDLLIPLQIPANWPTGTPVHLTAKAKWLVCKDLCIPGSADYSLDLAVGGQTVPDPARQAEFAAARALLPQDLPAAATTTFSVTDGSLNLALRGLALPAGAALEFFPINKGLVQHSAAQRLALEADGLRLSQTLADASAAAPDAVDGVLVVNHQGATTAYALHATPGTVAAVAATAPVSGTAGAGADTGAKKPLPLPLALLFAVLGGVILNLMPCVFPVLSLKALALAHAGAQEHHERRRDALAYTAGVLLSFIAVAGVLLALRAGGQAFGWGFQLQSPPFVAFLAYLMFAVGLAMSGVATFGTRLMGAGQSLTELGGVKGSFFTGVLAVLVASPCTGPYMAAALGYALTQPAALALLVFTALGLGLALPFLLIGFVPAFSRWLPRPGAWMETFKQILAFPMYLTSAGLIWVLARQAGADGAGLVLLGLVLIAYAFWAINRSTRLGARVTAALAGLIALALLATPAVRSAQAGAPATLGAGIEPYSGQRLAELRAQHRTVFVNFTADWCITCKVNERVTLDSARVRDAFAAAHVARLEGDWTRYDPAITAVLEDYGRSGVPLYLLYVDGQVRAQVLPQVLTTDDLIAALPQAATAP